MSSLMVAACGSYDAADSMVQGRSTSFEGLDTAESDSNTEADDKIEVSDCFDTWAVDEKTNKISPASQLLSGDTFRSVQSFLSVGESYRAGATGKLYATWLRERQIPLTISVNAKNENQVLGALTRGSSYKGKGVFLSFPSSPNTFLRALVATPGDFNVSNIMGIRFESIGPQLTEAQAATLSGIEELDFSGVNIQPYDQRNYRYYRSYGSNDTPESVALFLSKRPTLHRLNLSRVGLDESELPAIKQCVGLEELDVSQKPFSFRRHSNVFHADLSATIAALPQLQHVKLNYVQLTGEALQAFESAIKMQTIALSGNTQITPGALVNAVRAWPDLRKASLRYMRLTDDHLKAFYYSRELIELDVTGNPNISDQQVEVLASKLPRVRILAQKTLINQNGQ